MIKSYNKISKNISIWKKKSISRELIFLILEIYFIYNSYIQLSILPINFSIMIPSGV